MTDITNARLLYLKALLFLLGGVLASVIILLEHPDWKLAALLALTVWCFARTYYFAFYVIEHYVDNGYKFVGLWSFLRFLLDQRRRS